MQFDKLERLLGRMENKVKPAGDCKPFRKQDSKLAQEKEYSNFNSTTSMVTRSTLILKSQIESFANDRKIVGKSKRLHQANQSFEGLFEKSKSKKHGLVGKRHPNMNKSTITDLKKYVDANQTLGKRDPIESYRSPSKLKTKKCLSDIRPKLMVIDTECKQSVSTLETPGRLDKNRKLHQISDLWKQMEVEDLDFIRKVGNGKFSQVYLVKDRMTQFCGALKIIRKSQLNSSKMLNQFIREIKIHSHVKHPNIINLYSSFCDDGNVYLLQEFGNGGQLYKKLKQVGTFSEKAVSFIIRGVLEAVKYLHSKKILHRDIKPQNIVLVHGNVKICDFGWAVYQPNRLRQTLCGTPLYSSPQLVKGQRYSDKIDLWTIGMLTYQLFFGTIPFRIEEQEDLARIATDEIVFPMNSRASPELQDFVLQLLKKDPRQRLTAQIMLLHPFIQKYIKVEVCEELYS